MVFNLVLDDPAEWSGTESFVVALLPQPVPRWIGHLDRDFLLFELLLHTYQHQVDDGANVFV